MVLQEAVSSPRFAPVWAAIPAASAALHCPSTHPNSAERESSAEESVGERATSQETDVCKKGGSHWTPVKKRRSRR